MIWLNEDIYTEIWMLQIKAIWKETMELHGYQMYTDMESAELF